MLLIFPPVAKPSEPPAGIARLSATLRAYGQPCRVLDANLEGLLYLLEQPVTVSDTWTKRAAKHVSTHVAALQDSAIYAGPDRYQRAVRDVSRVLAVAGQSSGITVGLADYADIHLSPVRSADLLTAAERPEDNIFYPYFSRRLTELLETSATPVVGLSLNYLSQALCTFAMIGFIRRRFPSARIVVGGGLITSWLQRPGWKNPFGGLIDHLVGGPGELPLLEILGAGVERCGHVAPAYNDLPMADYLSPGFILPYSAASGCYWNGCSFCPERAEGNAYFPVPVKQAVADLKFLVATTKPSLIHLLDNAVSPALLRALADNPPGVPWYGFARIGAVLADLEFCRTLKRSGCVMLKLGLESGDQGVLDRLGKGIDVETASRVLQNLREAGIETYVYLLFGTPAETEEEARRTLEFVVRHHETIGFLNLALFNMPVGAEEAAEFGTEPFYAGDLSLYTGFRHPQGWDRKAVRRFVENEFKRHPAVAEIVRRDPFVFTSNHAAFFSRFR